MAAAAAAMVVAAIGSPEQLSQSAYSPRRAPLARLARYELVAPATPSFPSAAAASVALAVAEKAAVHLMEALCSHRGLMSHQHQKEALGMSQGSR